MDSMEALLIRQAYTGEQTSSAILAKLGELENWDEESRDFGIWFAYGAVLCSFAFAGASMWWEWGVYHNSMKPEEVDRRREEREHRENMKREHDKWVREYNVRYRAERAREGHVSE
jgi:anaerobic ribonucleoside-triphosphate reductase